MLFDICTAIAIVKNMKQQWLCKWIFVGVFDTAAAVAATVVTYFFHARLIKLLNKQ